MIDPIIQKLKDLHRHIQSHDTYRFYSSSLLIMYDSSSQDDHPGKGLGNDKAGPGSNPVDVRMIDFAHSTHSGFQNDTTVHSGPDRSDCPLLELIEADPNLISWHSQVQKT